MNEVEPRPVSVTTPVRKAHARLSKVASARDTIAGFGRDRGVLGLTFGQFSLLDLIDAVLEITGPADVVISTWSAGFYDVDAAVRWRDSGRMLSVRFVMDSSDKRGQSTPGDVSELFGADAVRVTRSHAKFVLLSNDDGWRAVITTSMNLNKNTRIEHFDLVDDPDRFGLLWDFADALWRELPSGSTGDRTLPGVESVASVRPSYGVAVTERIAVGPWVE